MVRVRSDVATTKILPNCIVAKSGSVVEANSTASSALDRAIHVHKFCYDIRLYVDAPIGADG